LVLCNTTQLVIKVPTGLILVASGLDCSSFVVQSIVTEVLVTESGVVQSVPRYIGAADILTAEVWLLTIHRLRASSSTRLKLGGQYVPTLRHIWPSCLLEKHLVLI